MNISFNQLRAHCWTIPHYTKEMLSNWEFWHCAASKRSFKHTLASIGQLKSSTADSDRYCWFGIRAEWSVARYWMYVTLLKWAVSFFAIQSKCWKLYKTWARHYFLAYLRQRLTRWAYSKYSNGLLSVRGCPHFQTWISLRPVGQSWSNFICSISGVGGKAA